MITHAFTIDSDAPMLDRLRIVCCREQGRGPHGITEPFAVQLAGKRYASATDGRLAVLVPSDEALPPAPGAVANVFSDLAKRKSDKMSVNLAALRAWAADGWAPEGQCEECGAARAAMPGKRLPCIDCESTGRIEFAVVPGVHHGWVGPLALNRGYLVRGLRFLIGDIARVSLEKANLLSPLALCDEAGAIAIVMPMNPGIVDADLPRFPLEFP